MNDLVIFGLLFVAVGIGWLLGRRSAAAGSESTDLPSQYYRGLNYLLDGRSDGAVDAFVGALEVNSETLETHIALGNLLRKKGEVDKAIQIHQNLLARPSLPRAQIHQAHLELARDYISAGLHDRAERLLLDLRDESPEQRERALCYLQEIYQSERDWLRAIEAAEELLPRKARRGGATTAVVRGGQSVSTVVSHYRCELAAEKLQSREFQAARKLLQQTLARDRDCVRASLMLGEVEYISGHYRESIKALKRVQQQDPDFLPETITTLRQCYLELGEEAALRDWLRQCLQHSPAPTLVIAVAEDMARFEGQAAACEFLFGQLTREPSLRGLEQLIILQMGTTEGKPRDDLGLLQLLVQRLQVERPVYRCGHCGFSGMQLHWLCPGCKYWGSMKAIRGSTRE